MCSNPLTAQYIIVKSPLSLFKLFVFVSFKISNLSSYDSCGKFGSNKLGFCILSSFCIYFFLYGNQISDTQFLPHFFCVLYTHPYNAAKKCNTNCYFIPSLQHHYFFCFISILTTSSFLVRRFLFYFITI